MCSLLPLKPHLPLAHADHWVSILSYSLGWATRRWLGYSPTTPPPRLHAILLLYILSFCSRDSERNASLQGLNLYQSSRRFFVLNPTALDTRVQSPVLFTTYNYLYIYFNIIPSSVYYLQLSLYTAIQCQALYTTYTNLYIPQYNPQFSILLTIICICQS